MDYSRCTPSFVNQLLLLICIVGVRGFLFRNDGHGKWDALKTTWGLNPFSSIYFDDMPRTENDAIGKGFVRINSCTGKSAWRGSRYVKSGDYAVVLMFDKNGYIAGIQTGVPNNMSNGFPSKQMANLFVEDDGFYFLTAYFVKPSSICTNGRTASEYEQQGTGTDLYFQQGNNLSNTLLFPRNETGLQGTQWVKGKCFVSMGQHYWYDFRKDTDCSNYFPLFLMYNDGRLNAFGWALAADLTSSRYEHPSSSTFKLFMEEVPRCLYNLEKLSTMHIFLNTWILRNTC